MCLSANDDREDVKVLENASLSDDVLYKPLVTWTILLAFSCMWYLIQPSVVPMELEVIFLVWIPCILIMALTLYTLALSSIFTLRTRYLRSKGFTGRRHPITETRLYKVTYSLPIVYVVSFVVSLVTSPEITDNVLIEGGIVTGITVVVLCVVMVFTYFPRRKRRIVSDLYKENGD